MSESDPSGHAAEAHHAEVSAGAGTQAVGSEARPLVNANAPKKSITLELVVLPEVVCVRREDGGVHIGKRLGAQGRCPGTDCKRVLISLKHKVIDPVARNYRGKVDESRCPYCGQLLEAYPRMVLT